LGKLAAVLNNSQIGYLILYVTNRCNFRCEFCFYYAEIEKGRKPDELSIDEIERLAKSVGPLVQLSLTGGEPFLRRDLDRVADVLIRHCRPTYVTIPTNASLTDRMVLFLEKTLADHADTYFRLTFSIDGIGDDHDRARSMPGSYDKILASYDAVSPLRERFDNLVLDANAVFTAETENTLLGTLRVLDRDFRYDNLSVTYARGDIKDPTLKTEAAAKYRAVNDFLKSVERRQEKRFLYPVWRGVRDVSRENLMATAFDGRFVTPCVAGRKLVVVSETGVVLPCEILGKPMGSLREVDFDIQAIMASHQAESLRREIVDTKCTCTFECALAANVVWNPSQYPRLLAAAFKNIGNG